MRLKLVLTILVLSVLPFAATYYLLGEVVEFSLEVGLNERVRGALQVAQKNLLHLREIDPEQSKTYRAEFEGVRDVHDLHAWTISTGLEAVSGHLIVERFDRGPDILDAVNTLLRERFQITHTTFQLEPAGTSLGTHAA